MSGSAVYIWDNGRSTLDLNWLQAMMNRKKIRETIPLGSTRENPMRYLHISILGPDYQADWFPTYLVLE